VIADCVMREPNLVFFQGAFLAIDLVGIWRRMAE